MEVDGLSKVALLMKYRGSGKSLGVGEAQEGRYRSLVPFNGYLLEAFSVGGSRRK